MRTQDIFKEMDLLHREIDQLFRGAGFGRLFGAAVEPGRGLGGYPRINLREDTDNLYVEALLPGVEPDRIEMSMLGDTLTLAGERPAADPDGEGRICQRRERETGKFLRTVELPVAIEADKVRAEYRHGLLQVTLPKAAAAKPQKIDIQIQ